MRAIAAALIFAISFCLAVARPAQAQDWLDNRFDGTSMSREDTATLQVALAYTGDYYGSADGQWNDAAQKALEQYVTRVVGNVSPTFRHLRDLIIFMEDERVANNWQLTYSDKTNMSYLHPFGYLKDVQNKDAIEYLSDNGNFSLKIWDHDQRAMEDMHNWFESQAIKDSKPYAFRETNLWITEAKMEDDMTVYARSDFTNGRWTTLSMVVTAEEYFRMNVVATTLTTGGSLATLLWTDGGVIDQVVNGVTSASAPASGGGGDFRDQVRRPGVAGVAEAPPVDAGPLPEPGPSPEPDPPEVIDAGGNEPPVVGKETPGTETVSVGTGGEGVEPERVKEDDTKAAVASEPVAEPDLPKVTGTVKASGTGFYIGPTTLVTAAHVIEGCGSVAMVDGTPLEVLNADSSLDLAVLSGATDNGFWLKLSALEVPKLGEAVTALGYPYYTSLDQGLTVTSGNVSALRGVDGSSNRVMISAPVQPGNSGGPLLNKKGAVIGVVVSRLDDQAVLEETGSLPQNMNFAVPSGPLLTFLAQSRITRPQGAGTGSDISTGVPEGVTGAVVPLYCYE